MVSSTDQGTVEWSRYGATARHAGWSLALRGVLAVVFGVITLRSPGLAASAVVIVFAVYAICDGVVDFVVAAQRGRAGLRWGWFLLEGLASVALGVIALAYPGVTLLALVLLVALRALVLGIVELLTAFSSEPVESRWLLGLTGVVSIFLGILLMGSPRTGGLALLWTIGVYGIVFGVMLFALGLRTLRGEHERERGRDERRPPAQPLRGPAPTT